MDGNYVNGWQYEKGKVKATVGAISKGDVKDINSRGVIEECHTMWFATYEEICYFYYVEGGELYSNGCQYYFDGPYIYTVCRLIDDENGDNVGDYGGGGNPITPTVKQPEIRVDCGESGADRRSNNARIVINDVGTNYNNFKDYTYRTDEYVANINWNGKSYVMTSPVMGGPNSAPASIGSNTVYAVHTHTLDSEPPSPQDFNTLLYLNGRCYSTFGATGYNLEGAIIINNNTEYLISIADRQKAYNFTQGSNVNIFQDAGVESKNIFKDPNMEADFNAINEKLISQGYKDKQSNYTYTMSYLLDKYNTGLTISTKSRAKTENFKEIKTNYNQSNNSYNPTKCP